MAYFISYCLASRPTETLVSRPACNRRDGRSPMSRFPARRHGLQIERPLDPSPVRDASDGAASPRHSLSLRLVWEAPVVVWSDRVFDFVEAKMVGEDVRLPGSVVARAILLHFLPPWAPSPGYELRPLPSLRRFFLITSGYGRRSWSGHVYVDEPFLLLLCFWSHCTCGTHTLEYGVGRLKDTARFVVRVGSALQAVASRLI
jgi:hypothetical protein